MSMILELLGKGLERPLTALYFPGCRELDGDQEDQLCQAIRRHPNDPAYRMRLGLHYAHIGSMDRAAHVFEQILAKEPDHVDAYVAWAAIRCDDGDLDEARELFERAYRAGKEDARVLFGLGYSYERAGEAEQAVKWYQQCGGCYPYLIQAPQRLAAIWWLQGESSAAIEQYEFLRKEHPEQVWIYLVLGQMYLETGDFALAREAFERALTIEPDNFEMKHDVVEELSQNGQVEEAIEQMKAIIKQQGDFPDNEIRLGDLYNQLGDAEAALEHYREAYEMHKGYLEAAVKLGTQYLRMKHYYEAAMHFNRAIEINDRLISAYVGLGLSQALSDQIASAGDTFELALALEPNTHLLYAEVTRLQQKLVIERQKNDDFLSLLPVETDVQEEFEDLLNVQMGRHRQSLQERPNHADLHYRYSLLLRSKGHTQAAQQHLEKALQINPSFFHARIKLALVLLEQQKKEAAIEHVKLAWQEGREFVQLHYKLGLMHCDSIHFALAVERFELTQEDTVQQADAQANLRLALQNMGLVDRAAAIWRGVCELEPESPMAYQAERCTLSFNTV